MVSDRFRRFLMMLVMAMMIPMMAMMILMMVMMILMMVTSSSDSFSQFLPAFSRATAKRTSVPIRARNSAFSGMLNISARPNQPQNDLKMFLPVMLIVR